MDGSINYLAVVAAAIAAFAIGGAWYAPFAFEAPWRKAAGVSEETIKNSSIPMVFGAAFIATLIAAYSLARILAGPEASLASGGLTGLLVGFGIGAMSIGLMASFERRPLTYVLINGGYLTAMFTAMGLILGGWR